jgi:hypothetical protein
VDPERDQASCAWEFPEHGEVLSVFPGQNAWDFKEKYGEFFVKMSKDE